MRIILYTGKGGVGKTSMAAASACYLAQEGRKVLVMSTDQAHSLGDAFDLKLRNEPTKVQDNLDVLEIDAVHESEKSWGNLKEYMKKMLTLKGGEGIEVEELLVFPGFEELFSMFKILEIYEQKAYDVLIVDCAPTGETLSLLKYPEMLSGLIEKVLPVKRKAVKAVGPAVEKIMKIPMPKENVFDDIEYLMERMECLQRLMLNKEVLSIRIVTTPEKIVIQEAKRNFTCLHLYNYNVDAILVNRIYPRDAMKGYFGKWIHMQEEGLREIKESFSEIPQFHLELQRGELRTIPVLTKIGTQLFEEYDIEKVLFNEEIFTFSRDEKGDKLEILLPFAQKDELDLQQEGRELVLSVKNETRRFLLPTELINREVKSAKYEQRYLTIRFGDEL